MKVTIDTSEVDQFVARLSGSGGQIQGAVAPVFKRAAQNIKNELQADFRGSSNAGFRAIAGKVNYDEPSGGVVMETEIGIDKGGAGNLGNIAVFGTYKGGGTHSHPSEYAAAEMPAFEQHLIAAVEGLI